MGLRTVRALGVLGASLGALLVPGTANAAFDVQPLACLAHPQPERPDAFPAAFGVFGYDNTNPGAVDVPLGSGNLVLEPPNFRDGQPTTFLPGRHDAAWVARFIPRIHQVPNWVLQGVRASTDSAVCGGGDPPEPLSAPTLGSGATSAAVGDALAIGVDRTTSDPVVTAIERCDGASCATAADLDDPYVPRSTYTVAAADAGYDLRVVAIRLTIHGWASALSTRVSVPGPPTGPAPQEPAADAAAVAPNRCGSPASPARRAWASR